MMLKKGHNEGKKIKGRQGGKCTYWTLIVVVILCLKVGTCSYNSSLVVEVDCLKVNWYKYRF